MSAERKYKKPKAFDIAIDENTKVQVRKADVLIEPRLSDFPRMDTSQIDALISEGYRAAKERIEMIRAVLERTSAS